MKDKPTLSLDECKNILLTSSDLTEEGDDELAPEMGDEEATSDLDAEMGGEEAAPVDADAADVADAMMDVESALAKLKAEFEEMVSGVDADQDGEEGESREGRQGAAKAQRGETCLCSTLSCAARQDAGGCRLAARGQVRRLPHAAPRAGRRGDAAAHQLLRIRRVVATDWRRALRGHPPPAVGFPHAAEYGGQAIRSAAPIAQKYGPIAGRIAGTAGLMLTPGNVGQNYGAHFPISGPYAGMEINPNTGRPWTPQELQQYR